MEYKRVNRFLASRCLLTVFLLLPAFLPAHGDKLNLASVKRFHVKEILADGNTWPLAKDIYLNKPWKLSNETGEILLSIVDSFPKMNQSIKGFYFVVIAKSYDKSDGFYSEGLGAVGNEYVNKNLIEFLNYFIGRGKLRPFYLDNWAKIYMLEEAIDKDNKMKEIQQAIYDDCSKKLVQCTTEIEKKVLMDFWMDMSVNTFVVNMPPIVPIYIKDRQASPEK